MKKSKEKKEGSEPVVDLVCYMILYEFDEKKRRDFKPIVDLTLHKNMKKKKRWVFWPSCGFGLI